MRKKLIWALAIFFVVSFVYADWYYNPQTGTIDYTIFIGDTANGDVLYYNGVKWVVLNRGTNGQRLTLAGGRPSWTAATVADTFTLMVDAAATPDYFGVAGGDGLFRFTANHFTMADGGNFVTLSLADHATARTALGLQIGNDVQAYDAALVDISGLTYVSPSFIKFVANDDYSVRTYAETAGDLEAEIEADIDTLANLTSIQGQTFTLAGAFVTQNNDLTINAAGAARTLTLNANSTLNQDLETTDDVQFADIHHPGFISTVYYNCGNSGASITIDWNNGNLQYVTLTAVGVDVTFTEPPNPGKCELWIIQDGTGDRTIDWTDEVNPEWPGGIEPTLSTGAADVDVIVFTFIGGTTYRGLFNGNFTT